MWLSLVERCVRDAEAAGSNPVISTKKQFRPLGRSCFFIYIIGFEPEKVRSVKNSPVDCF